MDENGSVYRALKAAGGCKKRNESGEVTVPEAGRDIMLDMSLGYPKTALLL